jgi:hypothetical protein
MKMTDLMYVAQYAGIVYGTCNLFAIEVETKKSTYKVVKAYKYMGTGQWAETTSLYLLKFYKKGSPELFSDFENARRAAIENLTKVIGRREEEVIRYNSQLDVWKS